MSVLTCDLLFLSHFMYLNCGMFQSLYLYKTTFELFIAYEEARSLPNFLGENVLTIPCPPSSIPKSALITVYWGYNLLLKEANNWGICRLYNDHAVFNISFTPNIVDCSWKSFLQVTTFGILGSSCGNKSWSMLHGEWTELCTSWPYGHSR